MLEAHRLGIEKRLKPAFMTPPIQMEATCINHLLCFDPGCCDCGARGRQRSRRSKGRSAGVSSVSLASAKSPSVASVTASGADAPASGGAIAGESADATTADAPAAPTSPLEGVLGAMERRRAARAGDATPAAATVASSGVVDSPAAAASTAIDALAQEEAAIADAEAEAQELWSSRDGRGAYEDFDMHRWEQFEEYRPGELLFTPMERQRLVLSILSARPADGGAGIDAPMLLAGKKWRVPLSAHEEADEAQREAHAMGFAAPMAPREFVGSDYWDTEAKRQHSVYTSMFCTHSSRARFALSGRWVTRCPPRVIGRPPLDDIREYFGEKVAFYFAFMHHYTIWLIGLGVPSLLSLLVQLLPASLVCEDAYRAYYDGNGSTAAAFDEASPGGPPTPFVCPGGGADNALVPFFAVGSSLWAIYFFKYWRRYQSELVYRWDMADFAEEEPTRPEFYRHPATRHDRVGFYDATAGFMPFGESRVPYFPAAARNSRFGASLAVTVFLMLLVAAGTLGIFALKVAMRQGAVLSDALALTEHGYGINQSTVAVAIASTLNTVFIMAFNTLYRHLGVLMTDWENHRTESEYENSLIKKNFAFQFVNSYISFFYIAFMKPFGGLMRFEYEAGDGRLIEMRDTCVRGDCMSELVIQMLFVVVGKQFLRNLIAAVTPCCTRLLRPSAWRAARRTKRADELEGAAKLAYEAALPKPRGLYQEYNEMAIQYGYVTMFATAAPWAAFLCLLNNLGERKADAMRMLYGEQRPRYQGASSIGAWATVFEILSFVSIATNVAIVGVTSNSLSQIYAMAPSGRITLCIVLEHLLLLLKFVVQVRVPDAPLWVRKAKAYQQWLTRRGMQGMAPSLEDAALLQAVYDDDDDEMERFWL